MAARSTDDHLWDSSGQITSTGSANAYVIAITEQLGAYYQGMPPIRFKANFTNTGSATANIVTENAPSGIGAATLKKGGGATNLAAGDIVNGGIYTLSHDGTNFQVLELNTGILATANLADDSVTNAKLANMAEATIKGRAVGAGTGDPTDLTASQSRTIIGSLFGAGGAMALSASPTTLTSSDSGKLVINFNANRTANLPAPTAGTNFSFYTLDGGSGGNLTVNVNAAENIIFEDGTTATTIVLTSNQRMTIVADGGNWIVVAANFRQTGITAATAQATTSGTTKDFTGIPAGTKRITVILDRVSLSGTDAILVQIGDSGGIETTGYLSSGLLDAAGGGSIIATSTAGFVSAAANAARVISAIFTITRITGNDWVCSVAGMASNPAGTPESALTGGGSKTLSADLDRVRILTSGANSFDAGAVNILYE